ncbi:MAG: metallophosphoesterase [Lentisphaeria bacterium]|nr:metallophosphoesterase [Lentisphaeria bacterium]
MKKHLLSMVFLAAVSLAFAGDAPKTVYTHYHNWTMQPGTVKDAAAADNVRHQDDLTTPMHGPWLLNPAQDFITINWITRRPCAGGIQYREKGSEEFKTVWEVKYGTIDFSKDLHTIHLKNLKPGTEYEYRLLSALDRYQTPYSTAHYVGREINSFKTLDPKKDNYKVFLTADFHGVARLCLDPMYENSNAKEADFFLFLGDNVEDSMGDARYYTTFGFLDDAGRLWGKNKPSVYIRGNHDLAGKEMYQFGDYFPHPSGETYQAFRQGPVLFICLDTMWRPGKDVQAEQTKAYFNEQVEWLKELKKTKEWKTATFRVVLAHVALYCSEGAYLQPFFGEVLNDTTPEGRIHAYLAGHEHLYYRINGTEKAIRVGSEINANNPKPYNAYMTRYDIPDAKTFNQIVLHQPEAMILEVTPQKLIFKSYAWRKVTGGLYDAFEIMPDATVKDLIPVHVFPKPEKKK